MASEPIHTEHNEAPAPLAVEQVTFCRKSDCPRPRKTDGLVLSDDASADRLTRMIIRLFPLGFVLVLCFGLGKALGINNSVCFTCCLIVVLAVLAYWIIPARRFARQLDKDNVPESPRPGARLQCIGSPSDLPQATRLESVPFEPRVYHFPLAAIGVALATMLLFPGCLILDYYLRSKTYFSLSMLLVCFVAVMITLRPLYFRISPGRLEVLRYGYFSRKASKVYRYDLRKARIVADLRRSRVLVYESPESSHACLFRLMPDRKEVMLMFFLAAVSEYETPELSDEVL